MVSATGQQSGAGASAGPAARPRVWAAGLIAGLLVLGGWWLASEEASEASRPADLRAGSPGPRLAPSQTSGRVPAAGAAELVPEVLSVRILALRRDDRGRLLARLQVGQDPPRLAQVGDVVALGLRVERIAPDGILLRRGLRLEQLAFAGRVEGRPAPPLLQRDPPPSVIVSPPGMDAPRSSGIERAIQRATLQAGVGTGH